MAIINVLHTYMYTVETFLGVYCGFSMQLFLAAVRGGQKHHETAANGTTTKP